MSNRKRHPRTVDRRQDLAKVNAQRNAISDAKVRWWNRTWAKATAIIGVIITFLSAPTLINNFVSDSAKLPDTYHSVSLWVRGDKHFVGEWTNDVPTETKEEGLGVGPPLEGLELHPKPFTSAADAVPDQGAVSMVLNVENGLVTGEVTSREIRNEFLYSHLFVGGVVRFRTLYIHVWDYISGSSTPLTGLQASWERVEGEDRLEFTSGGWLFPKHFYLERGVGPKPSFNLKLVEKWRRDAEKTRQKQKGATQ